ncbi:MAG: DUF4249 domain-containing protein [Prolixibacteraceae bacterium]|jgi:hypothetical protein|nr:DUF4249 domain-containing protein [Prolixibacteraceae bacterium]
MSWQKIFLLLFFLLALVSCEEEVVLDLDEVARQLVVEAILNNEQQALKVSLSYSQGFYSDPEYVRIKNAEVTIHDDSGNSEILKVTENGVFLSSFLAPHPKEKYKLNILGVGMDISVETVMPREVEILNVKFVPNPFWGADSLNAFVEVEDPVGKDNYFRLFVRELGVPKLVEYYLVDDSFGKDDVISMPVYYKNYEPGDTVVVELRHLTKDTYDFYSTLSDNINESFNSIAPGNPVSNMPPGVMGHFSAYYVDMDTIIVPDLSVQNVKF